MKILFYDMGSYTYRDFLFYLRQAGHTCKTVYYHFPDKFNDSFFCERFAGYLNQGNYDMVVSVNFFPLVAKLCHESHIKYLSWSYDSPLEERLKDYFAYETNYIFLFDRAEAEQYRAAGCSRVFHLPLAVNTARLDSLQYTASQNKAYQSDISFVGHLYDSPLNTLLYAADSYTRGYIEGMIQAQLRIYGYYFVDDMITEELLEKINASLQIAGQSAMTLNRRGLSYAIAAQITHIERSFLLEQMGELYTTHFYTTERCSFESPVKLCGPVKYYDEMPAVFRNSKLNLNPTLRSIQSGIPLRALDILGSGGLLMSNFQPELAEYFEDGSDVIMYESMEDAFAKADFYLKREDLCRDIAHNGYTKAKAYFTYPQRIEQMLKIAASE